MQQFALLNKGDTITVKGIGYVDVNTFGLYET